MSATAQKLQIVEQKFEISFFTSRTDNQPKVRSWSWSQILDCFQNPSTRNKKEGQTFSPAAFLGTRAKKNVKCISMLVLDYDHEANLERDLHPWKDLDVRFLVHTTHSHLRRTESNANAEPRFRIVIPLAVPIPANDFPRLWQWAADQSGDKIDRAPVI